MTRYFGSRLIHGALSVAGIVLMVFFLSRMTGSPARHYLPIGASQEMVREYEVRNGLDRPIIEQLVDFVGGVLRLDFGKSLLTNTPAIDTVLDRYPATLSLGALSLVIGVVCGASLGVLAAHRPGSVFDRVVSIVSLIAFSTPQFWIAIIGILVFAVKFQVLPTSGKGSVQFWILPLATLSLQTVGIMMQVVRSSMVNVLKSDYIRVARGKGVKESSVLFVHALRNAAIPAVTVAGTLAAGVLNGAIVVETVFGWPGVGNLMINAIKKRDFAVVQAATLVTATAIIIVNALVDVAYTYIDPKIHFGRRR